MSLADLWQPPIVPRPPKSITRAVTLLSSGDEPRPAPKSRKGIGGRKRKPRDEKLAKRRARDKARKAKIWASDSPDDVIRREKAAAIMRDWYRHLPMEKKLARQARARELYAAMPAEKKLAYRAKKREEAKARAERKRLASEADQRSPAIVSAEQPEIVGTVGRIGGAR